MITYVCLRVCLRTVQAVSECGCAGWDLHSRLSLLHTLIEAAADTRLIHDEIEKMMEAREKLRREHATLKAKVRFVFEPCKTYALLHSCTCRVHEQISAH